MRFLRKWLSVERPQGVSLNPSRTIEIEAPAGDVFDRCMKAVEQVLGGHADTADRKRGEIEATFGLINSERLSISFESLSTDRTRVRIQSRRGAISQQPRESSYVDALTSFLSASG